MATEDSLPESLDVRDPSVEGNHDRQTPEEQDKDADNDQPPDGDGQHRVIKVVEGRPGSNVHETSDIEEEIDDRTEYGLLCLSVEETIPGEGSTTTKGGEEVVGAEHGTGTNYQQSEGNVLGNVGLTVDQPFPLTKLHEMSEAPTEESTIKNRKYYLI